MPIPLRPDFDAAQVSRAARESKDANQVRRLLVLAAIYEGATRTAAAVMRRGRAAWSRDGGAVPHPNALRSGSGSLGHVWHQMVSPLGNSPAAAAVESIGFAC